MALTTIHIKTDVQTRDAAKRVADEFGFTLSSLVNALLKQVSRTKRLHLSLDETPTPYMIEVMRKAEEESQAGNELTFEKPADAIAYVASLIDQNETTTQSNH